MNAKELADALNGIEYSATMHMSGSDLMKQAKAAGLVVAYGFSDDLLEFDGAIYDEAGAPGVVLVDEKGLIPNWDSLGEDEDECAHYLHRKPNAKAIEAVWSEEGSGYAWTLKTDIPHEVFSIMEDGEGISRGIVFAMADLVPVPADPVGAEPGDVPADPVRPLTGADFEAFAAAAVDRIKATIIVDGETPEVLRERIAGRVADMGKPTFEMGAPPGMVQITTNGTTRTIPADEPVFLLRGQDRFAAAAVRYWTFLVEDSGGDPEIVRTAREHVLKMECWPVKKTPGLPMAMTTKQIDMQRNDPFLKEAVEKLGLPNATKEFTVRLVGDGRAIEVEAKHVDIDKIKKAPKVAVDQCCGKCKAGIDASGG